jgi:PilZ domain-containing protein
LSRRIAWEEAVADNRERATVRQRTFLQARISYGDGAISTDCTVVQLSAKGALLSVAESVALTGEFEVAIPQKDFLRRARLVRRKDGQAGVEFIDREPAAPAVAGLDIEGQKTRLRTLEAENVKLKAQLSALIQQVHRLTEE